MRTGRLAGMVMVAMAALGVVGVALGDGTGLAPGFAWRQVGKWGPDLAYARRPGSTSETLRLDLYIPKGKPRRGFPVVAYVHGGGWHEGDKRVGEIGWLGPELLEHGWAVASLEYRLAPGSAFPAAVDDVKEAIGWLRGPEGRRLGLNPGQVAVVGSSAGGHLAALAALEMDAATTGCAARRACPVRAVVSIAGPMDMGVYCEGATSASRAAPLALQGTVDRVFPDRELLLRAGNPIDLVTSASPPMLLVHGDKDEVVPLAQSMAMAERYRKVGARAELLVVEDAVHGLHPARKDGRALPKYEKVGERIASFLDRVVGAEGK